MPYKAQGFSQQFWEKAPGQNWEKNDRLNNKIAKLGEINNIYNKGSKIYPQNQLF